MSLAPPTLSHSQSLEGRRPPISSIKEVVALAEGLSTHDPLHSWFVPILQ